jgi:hypothetical protein
MQLVNPIHRALLEHCDPRLAGDRASLSFSPAGWLQMFSLASLHGVLGILLQNLAHASVDQECYRRAKIVWRSQWATSLRLRRYGEEALAALASTGVPAGLFKGVDFVDHLYPRPDMRATRDIDIIVPHSRWMDAVAALQQIGYPRGDEANPGVKYSTADYGEQNFHLFSANEITIDLHWNLISSPSLRKKRSIQFDDLDWRRIQQASGVFYQCTPVSRLLISSVHATLHHQFDRLLLLCDIREACRQITDDDVPQLRSLAHRTGTAAAVDLALEVSGRIFQDSAMVHLRRQIFPRRSSPLLGRIMSLNTTVCPESGPNKLRRSLVREWLKRTA